MCRTEEVEKQDAREWPQGEACLLVLVVWMGLCSWDVLPNRRRVQPGNRRLYGPRVCIAFELRCISRSSIEDSGCDCREGHPTNHGCMVSLVLFGAMLFIQGD